MQAINLTTPSGKTAISVGESLTAALRELAPGAILLVDENVMGLYRELFNPYPCLTIPAGEKHKTLQTVEHLYRELVRMEADRSSLLVGVGGGLATDVAGFVAATYLREVPFGFISTTLLGQVDASIGGKNGVNLEGYKNMIGTIRQPRFVWCDLSLLHTLAPKEYISGIAEVIKYGAIMDKGFLYYLEEQMSGVISQDLDVLERVVATSVKAKVKVVESDEKEAGARRLLNFGHTIGHAIERDRGMLHGEAVSLGMVLAARLSVNLGMLKPEEALFIEKLLSGAGLPVELSLDPEVIFENIRKDKKKSGEQIHFVLLDGLGNGVVRPIPLRELKSMLHDLC
ncbi:MAG: 3-dehydroquinate synthase [Bacteroidota bacterium]